VSKPSTEQTETKAPSQGFVSAVSRQQQQSTQETNTTREKTVQSVRNDSTVTMDSNQTAAKQATKQAANSDVPAVTAEPQKSKVPGFRSAIANDPKSKSD